MKFSRHTKLNAFTVFELTVVLALLSTIMTIIAVALNRFNEQLKNSSDVHAELNEWFAFRSNLWNELYTSDSIVFKNQELSVFRQGNAVVYRAEDEILQRKTDLDWISTGIAIEDIVQEPEEQAVTFNFLWKDEIMKLSYRQAPQVKDIIDRYFEGSDE